MPALARRVLIFVSALSTISFAANDTQTDEAHLLLDKLIGEWTLTGQMGSEVLTQAVDATWILGSQFVEVRVVETGQDLNPYEAVYLIGYDRETDEYVMSLFDTHGPRYARFVGIGSREGDSIAFRFDYPSGRFENTFTWQSDKDAWQMQLRGVTESGNWEDFATKTLTRK